LITAGQVQRITGLTADQLREWTTRRGLIEPDMKPCGPGSRARFSWQTVLLLRLAVVMNRAFHIELEAQRPLFGGLARRLHGSSFPSLRGSILFLKSGAQFELRLGRDIWNLEEDALVVRLDPHLDVISASFAVTEPISQLPLFPAAAVQ